MTTVTHRKFADVSWGRGRGDKTCKVNAGGCTSAAAIGNAAFCQSFGRLFTNATSKQTAYTAPEMRGEKEQYITGTAIHANSTLNSAKRLVTYTVFREKSGTLNFWS